MIRSGDTIHNPVTGERITFHQTSADTNGEAVVIECTVQPDGFVAAAHVHPSQTERFAVIDGRLGMKVGRQRLVLERGDVTVVEPGKAHRFWNSGDDEVRFVCEIRPARQFESLLETMFVLATEGKTNKKGMPNPLRLAVRVGRRLVERDALPGDRVVNRVSRADHLAPPWRHCLTPRRLGPQGSDFVGAADDSASSTS